MTNSLHPGVVRTELARNFGEAYGTSFTLVIILIYPLFFWFSKDMKQGAQTTIHCAVAEETGEISGEYFCDCAMQKLMPHSLHDNEATKLWQISEKLVGL